jgi:hypothetical protein
MSESAPVASRGIGVLSIDEAGRLGMSRSQAVSMIDRGLVEAMRTGFARMIPRREVERLERSSSDAG